MGHYQEVHIVRRIASIILVIGTAICCLPTLAVARTPQARRWVFSAPPRGTAKTQRALYTPFVQFLSGAIGRPLSYRSAHSWFVYGSLMARHQYAIVFDGPQFTAWRDVHTHYRPLVRLQRPFVFEIIARRGTHITTLRQLAGRPVCANSFPNLATIILDRHTSGVTPPYLIAQRGPEANIRQLLKGVCQATVVPQSLADGVNASTIRVLYTSRPYPNQALSAGPQVPTVLRQRIRAALLSAPGEQLAARLFHGTFVPAHRSEYAPYAGILNHSSLFHDLVGTRP